MPDILLLLTTYKLEYIYRIKLFTKISLGVNKLIFIVQMMKVYVSIVNFKGKI